ncbi:MAG: GNAT family N-acetyltransferase [Verrucomicrobiota bacterium]
MFNLVRADLSKDTHSVALVELLDLYARDLMGGGVALSDYTRQNLPAELHGRSGCHVVLAFSGEIPAGIAINFEAFSTFACRPILNIHDFMIAPMFRGQGLAKQLLEEIEIIARELGCCKLTLEVLEGNERAKKIYKRFGFDGYELDPAAGRALFFDKKLSLENR